LGQKEMNSPAEPEATRPEEKHLPADTAYPKLTLAQKKLAGSEKCLNCNTVLNGPFCYYCGQPDRNFMRFFPALLRDLAEDVVDFDSRFMRTLKPLLFKPGCLTKDFMSGRRFRYTPPMRLYIFSSIVFFLLAALFSSSQINVNNDTTSKDDTGPVHFSAQSEEKKQQGEDALSALPPGLREKIVTDPAEPALTAESQKDNSDNADSADEVFKPEDISFNGKPWNRVTNPINIAFVPDWVNDRLNDEVENSPKKAEQIGNNPNLLMDKVFDILPATMFVLLPLVALIFKFWYLFAKRYYVEHLIFSLHNHAFIFVCLTILLTANEASILMASRGMAGMSTALEWLEIVIWSWIPLYLLISLRAVYRQGWLMTILKFFLIGISYITLLGMVSAGVAIASFIML